MKLKSKLLLTAALLAPGTALAQGVIELDEALVFSGLIPVELNRTGASVDVLEFGDIEGGPIALDDRLERLPGVSVTTSGTPGSISDLRIRGLPQRYTGVTVDGIDVTDPSGPQTAFNFGTLTRAFANRVEVAKGSQTAFYGSNAIAGAINVTTWRPSEQGLSFGAAVEAGSYETYIGTFHAGALGDWGEAALTVTAIDTEGFSARPGNTEKDGFDQRGLSLYLARNLTDRVTLGFSAFATDSHVEDDDADTDPTGDYFEDRTGVRAFAKVAGDRIAHEFSVSLYDIDRRDPTGFSQHFQGGRTTVEYLGTMDLNPAAKLAFGADWSEETSDVDGIEDRADNAAVFGELQYAISSNADLSVSVRHDMHSDFDDQTTGRAALAYRVTDATTLKAVLGTGFRAPSLYERFGPFGSATLQPETSVSAELGVEHSVGAASVSATAFWNRIDDLIDFDLGTFTYNQVPGTTTAQGFELAGKWDLGRVTVFGNYTYTESENPSGRALRVPRHDLTIGGEAEVSEKLTGSLALHHVSDRLDVDPATFATVAAPDYTVTTAGLTYAVSDSTEAYLRVENVFDEDYEEVLGYNTPGRSFFVGVRASF